LQRVHRGRALLDAPDVKAGLIKVDLVPSQIVLIGGQDYFLSGNDMLMPSKMGQAPPDLRYFDRPKK
jgi:hypothetical protein